MSLLFLPCRVGIVLVLRLPSPHQEKPDNVFILQLWGLGLGKFRDPVEGSLVIRVWVGLQG